MFKVSKLTDYGVMIMVQMCRQPDKLYSAAELSEELSLGKETVAKCLKFLTKAGLMDSKRGATGGYTLARPAESISVADVVRALEGPVQLTECTDGHDTCCDLEETCPIKGRWDKLNSAIIDTLSNVTIAEMAQG